VSNSPTLSVTPLRPLGKIVRPGKKAISGIGMALIAVVKVIKKILDTSHAIF